MTRVMQHAVDSTVHTTTFGTPVLKHWLQWELIQLSLKQGSNLGRPHMDRAISIAFFFLRV